MQSTTIHPQFTTTSPQKTTQKQPTFPKHPSKTPIKQQSPGLSRGSTFFLQKAA
jgi:hypothetical protein